MRTIFYTLFSQRWGHFEIRRLHATAAERLALWRRYLGLHRWVEDVDAMSGWRLIGLDAAQRLSPGYKPKVCRPPPLEGNGFELTVPRQTGCCFGTASCCALPVLFQMGIPPSATGASRQIGTAVDMQGLTGDKPGILRR